jgi:hypothetical protein
MAGFLRRIKKRVNGLNTKMEEYQEVITFAESGHQEQAQRRMDSEVVEEEASKLLVVGRESTFSREVIDYVLEMAQRMSYEIIALNTAPLSCDTFSKMFSPSQKRLCEDFQSLSEENVRAFRERAAEQGVAFAHVVKFSEPDEALEEMKREHTGIEFVVSEAEKEYATDRLEEVERARKEIFVYSMV